MTPHERAARDCATRAAANLNPVHANLAATQAVYHAIEAMRLDLQAWAEGVTKAFINALEPLAERASKPVAAPQAFPALFMQTAQDAEAGPSHVLVDKDAADRYAAVADRLSQRIRDEGKYGRTAVAPVHPLDVADTLAEIAALLRGVTP